MAHCLNSLRLMRGIAIIAVVLFASCGGEKIPRDYQNSPPAMTHPPTSSSDTPSAHGMPGAAPEPSTGAEGKNVTRQPVSPIPPTETLGNQSPANTDTQHATQTTATAATGTHLATPP